MPPIQLIVFDCDGVLIDSEVLVCTFCSEELTRLGYPITPAEVVARYAGRPEREIIAHIEQQWARAVPPEYFSAMKRRIQHAFRHELRAVPYVDEVLRRVRIPMCVASSSNPEKLRMGLEATGLFSHFAREGSATPAVISAAWVTHGKPAPDVFIYAAGWMRTPVENCLVLEDSVPGVRAARAAGMRVFGFTGGAHCDASHAARLLEAGAEQVLPDMRDLLRELPHLFAPNREARLAETDVTESGVVEVDVA
jgi:HAD superfamily hydrolase (TIGR01509 family)